MRAFALIVGLMLAPFAVQAASDADDATFRTCVAEAADEGFVTTYHHCTGALVAHCGASATAAEAVACIDGEREGVENRIATEMAALSSLEDEQEENVRATVANSRSTGEASCGLVAERDKSAGLAIGQRAVNGAFCRLIASGDVYGLLLKLEAVE